MIMWNLLSLWSHQSNALPHCIPAKYRLDSCLQFLQSKEPWKQLRNTLITNLTYPKRYSTVVLSSRRLMVLCPQATWSSQTPMSGTTQQLPSTTSAISRIWIVVSLVSRPLKGYWGQTVSLNCLLTALDFQWKGCSIWACRLMSTWYPSIQMTQNPWSSFARTQWSPSGTIMVDAM